MKIYQVDAFTDQPFHGNPAGVCILENEASEEWMQSVATEMNLSETAFLWPLEEGYSLRWFTPTTEVDLCGHATLASAHILCELGMGSEGEAIQFHTKSGRLTTVKKGVSIEMDFPAEPAEKAVAPAHLLEGLGVTDEQVAYIGRNRMDYVVELREECDIKALKPNWTLLEQIKTRGIIVTSASVAPVDFISRAFFPAAGINEDPVTGSAHCCLGPYWQKRLGKDAFLAYQASARGGYVQVQVKGDRVLLAGQAVTVLTAEMHV